MGMPQNPHDPGVALQPPCDNAFVPFINVYQCQVPPLMDFAQ